MNIVQGLLILLTVWSPIWAYLIWITEIKGSRPYIYSSIILLCCTIILAVNPLRLKGVTAWLHYYSFFLIIYLLLVGHRYDYKNFNKVFAIGIFMVFLAGEWWEFPVFIFDFLGKTGVLINKFTGTTLDGPWIFSHIRRLYTLASAWLFILLTKVKSNGLNKSLFAIGSLSVFLMLYPLANGRQLAFEMSTTMARIICLSFMGYIVYSGLSYNEWK